MKTHFLTLSLLVSLVPLTAHAGNTEANYKGLTFSSDDGRNELNIGGRIHYDVVRFNNDITQFKDDNDLRRARLSLSGKVAEDWRFKIERDVGGTAKGWKNLWLGYEGIDHWSFRAGNMIVPVGMEQQMSSNDSVLMERSLAASLSPGFMEGVLAKYDRNGWTAALGYFGDPVQKELGDSGANGKGFAGRATYAPIRRKGAVLHLGASFEDRSIDKVADPLLTPNVGYRLRARPGTGLSTTTLIDTRPIADADHTSTVGFELGGIAGPLSLLAEGLQTRVGRTIGPDVDFNGWHATAGWVVTGESRRYSRGSGVFGDVRPSRSWGAVELSLRYDRLDLEDKDILGGIEKDLSYGVTWYLGRNYRLMYNHVRAEATPNRNGLSETMNLNEIRAQIAF